LANLIPANIVVGLLQVNANPWINIPENGQKRTWFHSKPENIEIINIFGKRPNRLIRSFDLLHEKMRWSPRLQGVVRPLDKFISKFLAKRNDSDWLVELNPDCRNLLIDMESTHLTLPLVEVVFFKYFLTNTKADFLYMSNTSSYINLNKLMKFVETLPRENVYCGTFHTFDDIKFASGANRLISRDLVRKLVENFNDWDFSYVEDVSMGKLLKDESRQELSISSLNFTTTHEIDESSLEDLNSTIHFRLKSGNLNSRNDVKLMIQLHRKLSS
jgi:hypothetical protein